MKSGVILSNTTLGAKLLSGSDPLCGGVEGSKVLLCVWLLLLSFFTACDFNGPWDYYPEERDVYTGIYTYGYIISGETPHVCFSKVYELDETAAENFAFYDSASVTVKGRFADHDSKAETDTTVVLHPYNGKPNCFGGETFEGIEGESYTLEAFFKWDSAGHTAKSKYTAQAIIPKPVKVKGLSVPKQNGDYQWVAYNESEPTFEIEFLEYPMDMEFVKCALDYDKSVRGVLAVLNYDRNGSESQKTTINSMLEGMTEEDSTGYRGIALHDPLESSMSLGYTTNQKVADYNALDTAYLMNLNLPLGEASVDLYSTDAAYIDYISKVKASVSDSRIVPESNIENGMGVFSGMSKTTVYLNVKGDGVSMEHIAFRNCDETEGDFSDSWDSKGCRLYQDVYCSGMEDFGEWDDLWEANAHAYEYYRDTVVNRNVKTCYASNVKAAMMLDTTQWSLFLPDTINEALKSLVYADGLKRYCVASNFKSNKIADCAELEDLCLENTERNGCKEYLWAWCSDRNWDMSYEQCESAFVSRYYLEEVKSSIMEREVKRICDEKHYPVCKKENKVTFF